MVEEGNCVIRVLENFSSPVMTAMDWCWPYAGNEADNQRSELPKEVVRTPRPCNLRAQIHTQLTSVEKI